MVPAGRQLIILAGLQPTWTLLKKLYVQLQPLGSPESQSSLRHILCDPGFFQLWQVVRTFRRILHKQASLIDIWAEFAASYDGRMFAGPFTVLLRQLNAIMWKIASPPTLVDHKGTNASLHALEVNSLKEGAFYLNSQKAKFDNLTTNRCHHCSAVDTAEHRCLECPAHAECHAQHDQEAQRLWHDSPVCVREQLLLPRIPLLSQVSPTRLCTCSPTAHAHPPHIGLCH